MIQFDRAVGVILIGGVSGEMSEHAVGQEPANGVIVTP